VKSGDAVNAPQVLAWAATTRNLAGYRDVSETGEWVFFAFPEVFREEICQGFDHKAVAKELARLKMLDLGSGGKATTPIRIPGSGKRVRLYKLNSSILAGGQAEGEDGGQAE